jgi:DNA-binding transcriptional LysR family regulator
VLGDPLVTRKGRGIVPTPRAAELAPAIAKGLAELELAVLATPFDPAGCTRTFTLALADAGQVTWLPRIAERMAAEMPNARLRVVGIDSLVSLGDLTSAEIDLHIGVPARGPGLHADPLLEDPTVLVVRKGHRGVGKRVSQRALGDLHHVGVELVPGKGFRDPIAAVYARAGVRRRVALTVPSFAAAAAVVAGTDLVTTLPASLVAAHATRLRVVSTPLPEHTVKIALCWHERTHADPAAIAFRALVRGAVMT